MNRARRLGAGVERCAGRDGIRSVIAPSIDWDRRRSQGLPSPSGWSSDPLQEVEFIEDPPEPQDYTRHRVWSDLHGKLHFLSKQPVQPPQEATAASNDDARVDDVRRQLGRSPLEAGTNRLDDCRHGLAKRLTNFVLGEDDRLRDAVGEVPSLHFHRSWFMLSGAGRTERDLELLGLTLTNQEIVVFPDVLQDRLVHLVARDPDRRAEDDTRQRDYRDLGGSASDVDDQVPARLLNWQPGPDRRRDRPLDEIHVVRPGMLCGIADRPPFDLRDSR